MPGPRQPIKRRQTQTPMKPRRNYARKRNSRLKAVKQIRLRTETKSRTHAEMSIGSEAGQPTTIADPTTYFELQNDDAFTYIPPLSFLSMTQGTREEMMIGNSVYSKYCKMKISLLYPNGADMSVVPSNQYLVHGWLKTPTNWSTFTTPVVNNANRNDLKLFVIQRLKAYFDERDDKLKFIPRANTGFKILGYRKITNDKNSQFSTENTSVGPKNLSVTWSINRKVQYEEGFPNIGARPTLGPNDQFLYPNQSWLPFVVVYNPQFASMGDAPKNRIKIAYNDCHWFTDS